MTLQSARRWAILSTLVLARCAATAQVPLAKATPEEEANVRLQLGERFYDLSLSLAAATHYSKSAIGQSIALLEAANQMNPYEPRFLRLMAIMRERAGDIDGAIGAWGKYRGVSPDDEVAQISIIDLYLSQMQSNDLKLKYLNSILANPRFVNRVKAHAAVRAVPLLDQRSSDQALAMLAQARGYYPLPEVTLLEWQLLPASAAPAARIKALLNILRANPAEPDALARVADMLAAAGLSEESLSWYAVLLKVHQSQGTIPADASVMNYLTERYRSGESTYANEQLDGIIQRLPEYIDAWYLRLTIARGDESAQMLNQAQQIFRKRVNEVCNVILSGSPATRPVAPPPPVAVPVPPVLPSAPTPSTAPATTQPGEPVPPYALATKRILALSDPVLRRSYEDTLADLAWFELYFDHNAAAAAPVVAALQELVPADQVPLKRLIGWQALVKGDEIAARTVFTAQQSIDPLSTLGLFRLEEQKNHNVEAAAIGSKIASEPHTGVLGAILWEAIKGRGFKPAVQPVDAAAIKDEVAKFPKDWLQATFNPYRFYTIRADPLQVGNKIGEPLLALITIENECKLDITIGDYGLIKPTIVLDAQLRSLHPQTFPGAAQDRLMGRQVLAPNESIAQVVRLDAGGLSDALRGSPGQMLIVNGDVVTNPIPSGPFFHAQAGGYAKNFSKLFMRKPQPLEQDAERRAFFAEMAAAAPREKMLAIEALSSYITEYSRPTASPREKEAAQEYINVIEKYRADNAPGVKIWASYAMAILTTGAEEQKAIGLMLQSNSWETRLLAMVAARYLPADVARPIAVRQSTSDPDPIVKEYATALAEMLKPPTTQPATISGAKE